MLCCGSMGERINSKSLEINLAKNNQLWDGQNEGTSSRQTRSERVGLLHGRPIRCLQHWSGQNEWDCFTADPFGVYGAALRLT